MDDHYLDVLAQTSMITTLGIVVIQATPERVVASMPVDERTRQPRGFLHGGASVALAETVASIGGTLCRPEGTMAFGMEINANHLRPVREGTVTATATRRHLGRSSSVWGIEIVDESGKLVCISRCTVAFTRTSAAENT